MRKGMLGALVALLLVGSVEAQTPVSRTNPSPRAVAEQMRECFDAPLTITDVGDPGEMPAVVVTTASGAFAIKEISVVRAGRAAVLLFTQKPDFALLHLTMLNTGQGQQFERTVVDCFYGAYIGRDAI